MSETTDLLRDMAERLFADACDKDLLGAAEKGQWPGALWAKMEEAGLTSALVPESAGGSGLGIEDAMIALRIAARNAAPVPFAETLLASWLGCGAGLDIPAGPLTIAPASKGETLMLEKRDGGWRLTGRAKRVPYARNASAIVVLADFGGAPHVAVVDPKICKIEDGRNLAMEPRESVVFDCDLGAADVAPAASGVNADALHAFGAAMRATQIAGSLGRVLDITLNYAQERVQFGKPISKFQAIQHNLAMLAAHSAAANAAADMGAEAAERDMNRLVIGAAKTRTGDAASAGAAIAHQVHGAIGFTQEYILHFHTKRLWSWRDEFGKESEWSLLIGRAAAAAGPTRLWSDIVTA
jgi:acyl-CoA dehydrogenase